MSSKPKSRGPAGPSQRQLRVGELVRRALSEVLVRNDIRDNDLKGVFITVSEVRVSPDCRNATAFVVPLGGGDQEVVTAALRRHSRYLRGELGHMLELKFVPELRFQTDTSFDEADRLRATLSKPEVVRDLQSGRTGDGASEAGTHAAGAQESEGGET